MQESNSASGQVIPPIVQLAGKTDEPFPMVDKLWEVFSKKGIRTVFLSVGLSKSALPDLELAEYIGCPIHFVPFSKEDRGRLEELTAILKERKRGEGVSQYPYTEGAESKWVLSKNIRQMSSIPWWSTGVQAELGDREGLHTESVEIMVKQICSGMKLTGRDPGIDILKIDLTQTKYVELTYPILMSILHAGMRPCIILIQWPESPDVGLQAAITAGFTQNMGYRLMAKNGNRFLYYYTDQDMYQSCSWEDTSCNNPMIKEITEAIKGAMAAAPVTSPGKE